MLKIMLLRATLFPEPVAPATNRSGMPRRSATTGTPKMSSPNANQNIGLGSNIFVAYTFNDCRGTRKKNLGVRQDVPHSSHHLRCEKVLRRLFNWRAFFTSTSR